MLSNYLAAARRNFMRNRVYSVIVTLSLAVGFAAMMLAAVYWRYEHSYDRFWPNADRIYLVTSKYERSGPGPSTAWTIPPLAAGPLIVQAVNGVEEATQLWTEPLELATERTEDRVRAGWTDGKFLRLFPHRLIAGDLEAALRPGFAVVTRSTAEKYFGRTEVVGESLTLSKLGASDSLPPARIGAVIEDWPADSHLDVEVLLGGGVPADRVSATLYLKVRDGVSENSLHLALQALSKRLPPRVSYDGKPQSTQLVPVPLRYAYARPGKYGRPMLGAKSAPHGLAEIFVGLGALMLVVSAINFVNLMTARGAGRSVEVGVRKVVGARRRDLVLQFVAEGLFYAAGAFVLALALVELTRPLIVSMTGQPLPFEYGKSVGLLAIFALGAVCVGVLASLYPAFVLSAIRPVRAIRNDFAAVSGSSRFRQILVVLQFIPLLILAGGGLALQGQQRIFVNNSLALVPANALVLREPCDVALKSRLRAIPGVASVACLEMDGFRGAQGLNAEYREIGANASLERRDSSGRRATGGVVRTDREALEYYDTEVVAGKLWSGAADERGVVLNRKAAASLGNDPVSLIGQQIALRDYETKQSTLHPVIGVIADRGGMADMPSTIYLHATPGLKRPNLVAGIRFSENADLVSTTAAIDKAFKASTGRMPRRAFDRDELLQHTAQEQRTLRWLALCVGVGLLMAGAGIFGMAVFLANLRTREIGVRKVFGASRIALLRLLVFQFVKPVLVANLVAIPLVIMLSSSIARKAPVDQRYTLTLSAIAIVLAGSLAITVLATFSQAWRVTDRLPLRALRSE